MQTRKTLQRLILRVGLALALTGCAFPCHPSLQHVTSHRPILDLATDNILLTYKVIFR